MTGYKYLRTAAGAFWPDSLTRDEFIGCMTDRTGTQRAAVALTEQMEAQALDTGASNEYVTKWFAYRVEC